MTGDQTSLDVSRRLAKVWPVESGEEGHAGWWLRMNPDGPLEHHDGTCDEGCFDESVELGTPIPAWPLSKLEAETKRMGLLVAIRTYPEGHVTARLRDAKTHEEAAFAKADTILDAWGNALAEAKEKP